MNYDQFAYWLQGFVEMNKGKKPTKQQWEMIKDHLNLCFRKITPPLQPYAKGIGTGGIGSGVVHRYEGDTKFYALMQGSGGGDGYKRNGGGGGC